MIPVGKGQVTGLVLGTLYRQGKTLKLRSEDGPPVNLARALVCRAFGSSYEGVEALPRFATMDADQNVLSPGDLVLVGFVDNNRRRPIILSTVARANHVDFLRSDLTEVADVESGGRVRVRVEPRNKDGQMTGRVDVRVGEGGEGVVDVRGTHRVVIRIGDDTEGGDFPVEITAGGGEVTIKADAVRLADPAATEALALASLVDARLAVLQSAHDTHVHPVPGVTAGGTTVSSSKVASGVGTLDPTGAEKVFGE